jgi:hypothetical protein
VVNRIVEREEPRVQKELGAVQKDTAREVGAKLASLKGIVWVGVGLFLFGLASMFYPPLKLAIGSITTSATMLVGGEWRYNTCRGHGEHEESIHSP